jgi:hypothetical protein
MIVVGVFFIGLFMLSNEGFYYFSELIPYTVGFLITGLIASFFGFLLSMIHLHGCEDSEIKTDNTTKIRVVLIAVSVLYLILIGYLMAIDYEWTVQPLIIELDDYPLLGFHYGFTISSYSALFVTLLIWGIFVLPFVIAETGFLDDSPEEQTHNLEEEGYTINEAEETFDRFVAILKRQLGPMNKIKNYTLPLAIAFTILGSCLVGLPHFLFIDRQPIENPETGIVHFLDYKGYIRGQLFLIGILLIVIGFILIIHYIGRRRHSVGKEILFSKR